MDGSPTRRRALQLGGFALATGLAGCLGNEKPEGTLDFAQYDRIDESALPDRKQYATQDSTFPKYRRYPAADAETVLVLLHNSALDSKSLQPLATAISEANVAHVITPDIRGHGPDPERRGDIDHIGQLDTDVRDLINRVRNIYPDETVVLGGHGAGGGLAVRFSATPLAALADAYLLLAPYLGDDAPTTRPGLGGWAHYYRDRVVMLRIMTGFGLTQYSDMEVVEFDIPEAVRDGTETPSYTYRLDVSLTPRTPEAIANIDDPCLTVVGDADETAFPAEYESLLEASETAETAILDGVSHLDLALDPTAFEPMIEWLDQFNG